MPVVAQRIVVFGVVPVVPCYASVREACAVALELNITGSAMGCPLPSIGSINPFRTLSLFLFCASSTLHALPSFYILAFLSKPQRSPFSSPLLAVRRVLVYYSPHQPIKS